MKQGVYVVQCPRCHAIAVRAVDLLPGKTRVMRLCEWCEARIKAEAQRVKASA